MANHQDDKPLLNELRRVGATLAALTALTLSNLNRFVEARRWWRSARQIAHGSGDVQMVVWVRGHEVVRSLYDGRSPVVVMRLVDEGEVYSRHAQPTARPRLIAGRAQALGMLGEASHNMANVAHANRIRPVVSLAHKVLEAVPMVQQRQPGVGDFRALLATPVRG
jgi:hypothetical protein